MFTNSFDAIILGGGAMGSATAYQLAKDGKKVLLLEQFEIAHNRASTHGESRIFRYAYTNLAYAQLAFQCKDLWLELEKKAQEKLLFILGGIDFAEDDFGKQEVTEVKNALQALGSDWEELDYNGLTRRYPQFSVSETVKAVYSPDSGVINPTRAIQIMTSCASNLGALIQDNEPVKQITATSNGVEILTDKGKYKASKLIISAGAWTNKLLKFFNLELPLQPSQEQTVYFRPIANKEQFSPEKFPIWINYRENVVYGIPSFTESAIKVGFHHSGYFLNVDDYTCKPKEDVTARLKEYIKQYIPNAAGEAFGATPCLYTNTPDHDFVVDLLPNYPNVAIAAGFSGHGFKFCIAIGRALADLVFQGSTEMKIQHLSIKRFL